MNQVPPHTNPILWKERLAFERSNRFSSLFKTVYISFGVVFLLTLGVFIAPAAAVGRGLFELRFWDELGGIIAIVVCLGQSLALIFFVPPLIAGSISEERKRETLELLFVTPLTVNQIVVGKIRSAIPKVFHLVGWMGFGLFISLFNSEVSFGDILLSQMVIYVTGAFVLLLTLYMSSWFHSTAVVLSVTYGAFFGTLITTFFCAYLLEVFFDFDESVLGLNFLLALIDSFLDTYSAIPPAVLYILIYVSVTYGLYKATERRLKKLASREL